MINLNCFDTFRRSRIPLIKEWIEENINGIGLQSLGIDKFIIAGSSLRPNEEINDFDIFPISENQFDELKEKAYLTTHNAYSLYLNGHKIQFASYSGITVKDIVESFDFASTKLGARMDFLSGKYYVSDIYLSDDYIESVISGKNKYCCGKTHPLESLIRAFKYHKRGLLEPKDVIYDIIEEFESRYPKSLRDNKPIKSIGNKDKRLMPT